MRISDWSSDVCSSDLSHFIFPAVWSARPASRSSRAGSIACTSCPLPANQAASRTVPAPTSATLAFLLGSRSLTCSYILSGERPSYAVTKAAVAAVAYPSRMSCIVFPRITGYHDARPIRDRQESAQSLPFPRKQHDFLALPLPLTRQIGRAHV